MKLWIGFILIIASSLYLLTLFAPLIKEETAYRLRKYDLVQEIAHTVPVSADFGIIIPKLAINSKVIKNVDPFDPKIYQQALSQGVAHAEGSSLPGESGNIFIFAHSSASFLDALKYNSIFYLLPKLEIGDEIILYYKEKTFKYSVAEKSIIDASNSEIIVSKESDELILMTCYPPGTTLKRFIVKAKPIKAEPL